MRRLAFLCVLQVLTASPSSAPEDVVIFNRSKSEAIALWLLREVSQRGCTLGLQGSRFPDLYFHETDDPTSSIQIASLRLLPVKCVEVSNLVNDIFGTRMDLFVAFPIVKVRGTITFVSGITLTPAQTFSLILRNVTGSGLCFTQWRKNEYRISDCEIHFRKSPVLSELRNPGSRQSIRNSVLAPRLVDRLWRDLTSALRRGVKDYVNTLLQRLDGSAYLRDPRMFAKYQDRAIKSTSRANKFVDDIIEAARSVIREKFGDAFAIPDIEEGFEKKGLLLTWRGSFKADRGVIRGLATIARVGDTAFATDGDSQTHFFGNLSFRKLDLHYDRYRARFMDLGATGTLNTRLQPIRLHVHPYLNFNSGRIYLADFKIDQVGELTVDVTGLGPILDWLASKITTWVVGLARDKIFDRLQKKYHEYIKTVLSGYTIDDIISGRAFDKP